MKVLYSIFTTLVGICVAIGFMPDIMAQTVSRYAYEDAITLQAYPDSIVDQGNVNGNILAFKASHEGELRAVYSYMKFDISHLAGTQVESASLSYRGKTGDADFADLLELELFSIKDDFDPNAISWSNQPARDRKLGSSMLNTSSARKDFINQDSRLIDYINESVRSGKSTIGFLVRSAGQDSTNNMWIGGAANGSFAPILSYTITPQKSAYVVEDAVVLENYPDSVVDQANVNGNILAFRTAGEGGLKRVQSYLKFDISQLQGQQLEVASLSYRGKTGDADFEDQFELELFSIKADFDPAATTWSNKPGRDRKLANTILNTSSARKEFINDGSRLVDYINEAIRRGDQTLGFMIRSAAKDSTSNMWIGGATNGSFAPILDYAVAPEGSRYATVDAVVLQAYPDSVVDQSNINGNILAFRESVDGALNRVQSYVSYDISGLKGQQISSASVSYRGKTGDADFEDQFGLELFSIKATYDADNLTWNSRPARDKKLANTILNTSSARKEFINDGSRLIDYINEEIRKGASTIGFMIRSTAKDSTSNMWIGGAANGTFGPILNYSIDPSKSCYGGSDAIVLQAYPDSVFDQGAVNQNILAYRESVDGELRRVQSYVSFDLTNVTTEIENASLSYRGKTGDADFEDQFSLELFSIKSTFNADSLTWNSRPGRDRKLSNSILNTSSARKDFINDGTRLTDYINEAIRSGKTSIGFLIRSTGKDSTNNMWIGGIQNGSFGPLLDLSLPNIYKLENDTLTVIEDVFVSQAEADSNFESPEPDMHVIKDETNSASKEVYLKFNISEATGGVGTATLMFRGDQKDPPTADERFRIEVFGTASDDWSEGEMTWNTKVETGDKLANYNITESATHLVSSADLTNYVNTAIQAGRTELTFVIKGRDETTFRAWISSKDWRPAQLALDYSTQEKTVVEDSYVAEATPEMNFDGTTAMQVAMDVAANNNRETYLKFELSETRSNVVSTALILKADQQRDATVLDNFFIEVYGVSDNSWDETTVNWNNKPATGELLMEYNVTESADHELASEALADYVKDAIRRKQSYISFVVKGKDDTPGSFVWISDQGWKPAKLFLDYRQIASPPLFITPEGDYIPEVTVELASQTPGASIYYTTDGSDPTDQSILYDNGILLTDTTTIRARAFSQGLAASDIVEATYNVAPVGLPIFTPNPAVEYSDAVTVTMTIEPEDAFIFYSDDGSDPLTPYPTDGILLTETTTIRARGVNAAGSFLGPIVEATYTVVNTVPGTGTGPAGVGAIDNAVAGQPENALWLRADAIVAEDGDEVTLWEDVSGNDNHAYNTYVENGDNAIPNTGESQKPAPTLRKDLLNGKAVMEFGQPDGSSQINRSLIIDDADNLDGGAGISIFIVFKRNQLFEDFAAIFQKRDIGSGADAQAYVLEFNGGADPNKIQFVIQRQLFLRNSLEFNTEDYYIVNTELQGDFGDAIFRTNGMVERIASYKDIVPAVDAPVIVGGFQPMNIAEVAMYKKGLNVAQNNIVHNYLAVKYGLDLTDGANSVKLYNNTDYIEDLIGIGKDLYIDDETEQEHRSASGAGLQIDTRSGLEVGSYVLAAHNGAPVVDANNWDRYWNVEVVGTSPNVDLLFNFEAVEQETPETIDALKLFYHDGNDWADLGLVPTLKEDKVLFNVDGIQSGMYTISTQTPGTVGIQEMDISHQLNVFPNPIESGSLNLELENNLNGALKIRMYDNFGRTLWEQATQKRAPIFRTDVDTEKLQPGLYMIEIIQANSHRAIRKFIKE